jgi:flagellar basal body-associated protein FliL
MMNPDEKRQLTILFIGVALCLLLIAGVGIIFAIGG